MAFFLAKCLPADCLPQNNARFALLYLWCCTAVETNTRLLSLQLGFKTAVGMPFKDIATADSIFLEQLPASDDKAARTALRRMQEVRLFDMLSY